MDLDLNEDQRAVLEAVGQLLDQYAGAARAIELDGKGEVDGVLEAALSDAGFSDIALLSASKAVIAVGIRPRAWVQMSIMST